MTRVLFIHAESADVIMQIETEETVPERGDMLVMPDETLYQCVQRTFVVELSKQPVIDLSAPRQLQVTIQCAMLPIQTPQDRGVLQ